MEPNKLAWGAPLCPCIMVNLESGLPGPLGVIACLKLIFFILVRLLVFHFFSSVRLIVPPIHILVSILMAF